MDIQEIIHKSSKATTELTCEFILNMWKAQPDGVYTQAEVTAELERYQKFAIENVKKNKP